MESKSIARSSPSFSPHWQGGQEWGVAILVDHLGPVDSIRFLRLLDKGAGDYTATRQNQSDQGSAEELCAEIRTFEATQAKP